MSSSRVLVLPSIQDGFGMVLAQAMACGCPVVASEHTGGRDLFEDGVEGFIVPIRDVPGLTVRLQQLADERGLWERMSAAALRRVALLGGWRDYGNAWAKLCMNLNAAGRPGTPPRE
jgi:glycosyltransferase involved in cell wall biosynthesis